MFQSFQTPVYAGFWLRFVAYLVDGLLMAAVCFPLGLVFGLAIAASGGDENSPVLELANMLSNLVSIAAGWLYHSLLESSSWQGTVGKKLLGLKVTDLDGRRIGFGRATGRYFGSILSGMICFIGFIMVAFTEKQQALHDMMAGTLVIRGDVEPYREPPPPPDFVYRGGTLGIG
ncbi:MAG: RDD family protein [Acidobacteriota bacterium]